MDTNSETSIESAPIPSLDQLYELSTINVSKLPAEFAEVLLNAEHIDNWLFKY